MEKKKKSALKIILNTLVVLVFIALVAVGSGIGYLYFKYKVNIFTSIDQISKLNGSVDESTLVTNGYTEEDYNSIETKINSTESTPPIYLEFTDRELCAYLNNNLDKVSNFNFGNNEINLTENGFQVLQIKLSNISIKQPDNEHYCDLNVILKLNIASIRDAKMNNFPVNLLKNFIPDVLYINADCSVDAVDGNYVVNPTSVAINKLSADATKGFFETINKFIKFTTAEELNWNVSSALVNALLGDDGIYGVLKNNQAKGYGWQSENKFVTYFVDTTEPHTITYENTKGASNSNNVTTYTIRNNRIVLENLFTNGYDFLGWYTDINDENSKVEVIEAWSLQDYTLTAKWQIITYTVTCDLRGGKIGSQTEYSRTYTIEDASFPLPNNAIKTVASVDFPFAGWIGDNINELTKDVTIEHGSWGDKHYTAYYEGENINLTLVVDGVTIKTACIEAGTILSLDNINSLIENELTGYTIDNWFTNDTLSDQFNYSAQVVDDQTIYATSSYLNDCVYFYPYLSQFDNAINNETELTISSRDMLIGYIDYCLFYDVRTPINLLLNYIANDRDEVMNELIAANNARNELNRFNTNYSASYGYSGGSIPHQYYAQYYLTISDANQIAINHFDGTPSVLPQQDYALRADDLNSRDDDTYNDFKIKYVGKSIRVSTSEQLVWALENGYNPVCEASSAAEDIYNQAKVVLRNICKDDMSDIEKLQAIYKWLALNVNYDQEAFYKYEHGIIESEQARTYDSWYPEGVFNYGKAVCEGYAKSLLIMAKLEGIPTICVSGNGHMWNKVYINGAWYGVDATHGDSGFESKEVFTYTAFLFTDAYKATKNYSATNYTDFTAVTEFDTYDNTKFTYHGNTYDLFINNEEELDALTNYVSGFTSKIDCDYYTLEIATNETRSRINHWLNSGWSVLNIENRVDSCGHSVFTLKHNK